MSASHRSYWATSAAGITYPPLEADRTCQVAVLGGGIVGITTALELAKAGVDVVLLEARRVGAGASGYNTGKVSSLNGLIYQHLVKRFGKETASAYGPPTRRALAGSPPTSSASGSSATSAASRTSPTPSPRAAARRSSPRQKRRGKPA